jgi:transposase
MCAFFIGRKSIACSYELQHAVLSSVVMRFAFLPIKPWRGIATRYAKNLSSFLAAAQIRCLDLWLCIS